MLVNTSCSKMFHGLDFDQPGLDCDEMVFILIVMISQLILTQSCNNKQLVSVDPLKGFELYSRRSVISPFVLECVHVCVCVLSHQAWTVVARQIFLTDLHQTPKRILKYKRKVTQS